MTEKDFEISIRPEIRKGCLWDIQFMFSEKFLDENKLNELVIDKTQCEMNENSAYLCLKVRSKLLYRELGINKVCEMERNSIPINQETRTAILKVKFTQRPRSVFHKHSDIMILVASVKSLKTNEILAYDEVELIFRGGTGSSHSAESKKRKNCDRNDNIPTITSHQSFQNLVNPYSPSSSHVQYPISPSTYLNDDETVSSSDESDSVFYPSYYSNPNKRMCLSQKSCIFDELYPSLTDFGQLENDPFYLCQLNDIHESMELIEWSKKEGLLNDDLFFGNENIVKREINTNPEEKFDIKEEIRKFKEEMMMMVNEKIESFKKRINDKLILNIGRSVV